MSCCGGNCGCGSACNCGSGCGGCKRFPNHSFHEKTVQAPFFAATVSDAGSFEGSVGTVAGDNGCACSSGGCNCGDKCTCNPCNCK